MRLPFRDKATNLITTLVWDTVICATCRQTYIRPTNNTELAPCPWCGR